MLKKMDSGWLGMHGDAPFKTGKKEEEECFIHKYLLAYFCGGC